MDKPAVDSSPEAADTSDAILLALKSQESRIAKLEDDAAHKGFFKKLTTSASTSALLLGLILTFVSLYDAFVAKPEADRIARLSQFNQTVNSVAKTQQEELQLVAQTTDPKLQLAIMTETTPQILNDLSTAQAMLRDLDDRDVGIPQLIVLINAASTEGDTTSVANFVARAVRKTGVSPYLHSEAKRYEGKYWFMSGDPERGRQSYQAAIVALGSSPASAAARGFDLADLVAMEYMFGVCNQAAADFNELVASLQSPSIAAQVRSQLATTMRAQLTSPGQRCPTPPGIAGLPVN